MPDWNTLAGLLRDGAQGASNAIAGNVSAPVDGLAWALRKFGVPIPSNPIGGSDWMAQQGLTAQPQNKWAGLLGETAGMVGPGLLAAKAPQVANGLLGAFDNMIAPSVLNKQAGGLLMDANTPRTFYHGTSGDHTVLDSSYSGSVSSGAGEGHWFSYEPGYAWEYAENAAGKRGGEPRIAKANLNVENPLTVKFNGSGKPVVNGQVMDFENNSDVLKFAKKNGHDSVDWPGGSFTDEPSFTIFDGSKARLWD